ncbi:MAG: 4Fe-4S binding protein [Clostridiales bacterium]|nr:4Fe-4S binding protein [Clostridiales bacterium]
MPNLSKNDLLDAARRFMDESPANFLAEDLALRPDLAGMRLYETPLMGVAAAGDPVFIQMQAEEAVGRLFVLPGDWLPGAQSVISFFFPFTSQIIEANANEPVETPPEWLHGRIEGQAALDAMIDSIRALLEEAGNACVIPGKDERFKSAPKQEGPDNPGYTTAWSERHVAYVCGLGTFGLSRGLITSKGMAGRFGSLVTTLPLEADPRPYTRYDEYCTMCGLCAPRCPVDAIDPQKGKNIALCSAYQQVTREKHAPRYGCGKCSVGVPCTSCIP